MLAHTSTLQFRSLQLSLLVLECSPTAPRPGCPSTCLTSSLVPLSHSLLDFLQDPDPLPHWHPLWLVVCCLSTRTDCVRGLGLCLSCSLGLAQSQCRLNTWVQEETNEWGNTQMSTLHGLPLWGHHGSTRAKGVTCEAPSPNCKVAMAFHVLQHPKSQFSFFSCFLFTHESTSDSWCGPGSAMHNGARKALDSLQSPESLSVPYGMERVSGSEFEFRPCRLVRVGSVVR